jgi:hypothetical protein
MTLQRLARELEETARQTATLVDSIGAALTVLTDSSLDAEEARRRTATMIVTALQGQDRIEQRCRDLALAAQRFEELPSGAPITLCDEIWASLKLDELRLARRPGGCEAGDDTELF